MVNPSRRTRRPSTTARYPVQLVLSTDTPQDEAVRAFAVEMNVSINQVLRDAVAAGLPVLRRRAEEDGKLAPVVPAVA